MVTIKDKILIESKIHYPFLSGVVFGIFLFLYGGLFCLKQSYLNDSFTFSLLYVGLVFCFIAIYAFAHLCVLKRTRITDRGVYLKRYFFGKNTFFAFKEIDEIYVIYFEKSKSYEHKRSFEAYNLNNRYNELYFVINEKKYLIPLLYYENSWELTKQLLYKKPDLNTYKENPLIPVLWMLVILIFGCIVFFFEIEIG